MEPIAEDLKAGSPRLVDLNKLANTGYKLAINTPESIDEIRSRLKLAEAEAEHKLKAQEAEDAHKRLISLLMHSFVMIVVAVAFGASVYIAINKDPTTGLPDKALGIITAIVAAGVG